MEQQERLRERTTLRYYDVYSISHFLDSLPSDQSKDFASNIAQPSKDVGLTALAQLVALRLNVQRCLISLFDTRYQYIIAEATGSLALRAGSESKCIADNQLWLSGTAINRSAGCCEHVLLPPDHDPSVPLHFSGQGEPQSAPGAVMESNISVVPDLGQDARFKDRLCVDTYPYNRFYAGCPIRTNRGIDIGVLCVFDSAPRPEGLDDAQRELMVDLSAAVMSHLEANRIRRASRRNERMVRGIGSFVEGSSTLAGWWSNMDTSSYDQKGDGEGMLDAKQQDIAKLAQINPVSGREANRDNPLRDDPKMLQSPDSMQVDGIRPVLAFRGMSSVAIQDYGVAKDGIGFNGLQQQVLPILTPLELHRKAIQITFAKASNIIRESLEVEGVVFLDARISSFGGMVPLKHGESTSGLSDVSEGSSVLTATSTKSEKETSQRPHESDDPACKLIAYATSDNSTINSSTIGGNYTLRESRLKAFIRRYPSGTVFNFDELGILQSSDSEGSTTSIPVANPEPVASRLHNNIPKHKGRRSSKINDGGSVLSLLPGARSAVFFPLWDHDRQRWFAGAIAWSSQARPFSTRGELSYLAAFANTIMSQVARLEAKLVDKAKTDLLGSISHELRSPLHGVLGGVEMLADTDIDPFQSDVLRTIETCGKTLLDTMDHLLDFAKINNFSHIATEAKEEKERGTRGKRRQRTSFEHENSTGTSGPKALFANVELDVLVEEVVESVCAGHQFHSRSISDKTDIPPASATETVFTNASSNLAVILNIDYGEVDGQQKDWLFNLVPGGFRRVVMNLFGNALKYTSHGTVQVSLSSSPAPEPASTTTEDRPPEREVEASPNQGTHSVVLTVTDTGRGISSNFLENSMFLPFTQEDRLNPGTGLGLSIAHSIVNDLHGTIGARSTVGVGTQFTVTLPLPQAKRSKRLSTNSRQSVGSYASEDQVQATKGLRIALVGFSTGETRAPLVGNDESRPKHVRGPSYVAEQTVWTLPRMEVENICRTKLAVEVLPAPAHAAELFELDPRPELLLTTEQHLNQLLDDLATMHGLGQHHVIPPIVAVCPSMPIAKVRTKESRKHGIVVDFISQPCGPRKLANAFALSMVRWSVEMGQDEDAMMPAATEEPLSPYFEHAAQQSRDNAQVKPAVDGFFHLPGYEQQSDTRTDVPVLERNSFLLVEDNPINMRILVTFMRKSRLEHDTAVNGRIALEIYKEHHARFRFIFMDISMPIMTGLEAAREIRSFERENNLPAVRIVALTALASESVQQEAFVSGIDLFLTKPVRLKELGIIIEKNLRDPQRPL